MPCRPAAVALVVLLAGPMMPVQVRRPAQKSAVRPTQAGTKTEPPEVTCPALLGKGVSTGRTFCDVVTGSDPAAGILIRIPPHRGPARLTFDLHNRQTYSEQEVRAKRAFARYVASIGVFSMDNTLLARAAIDSEFRTARDLVDRVAGGAGPGGVKAVAPTGTEPIAVEIPDGVDEVSILGERLTVVKMDGTDVYAAPGRPIAVISQVMVDYRPAPARKPVVKKKK